MYAVGAVKQRSVYVTEAFGGHGAIREAVEWLLDLRGDKDKAIKLMTEVSIGQGSRHG